MSIDRTNLNINEIEIENNPITIGEEIEEVLIEECSNHRQRKNQYLIHMYGSTYMYEISFVAHMNDNI